MAAFESSVRHSRAYLSAYATEHVIPGLSVAVAVDGEIAWSEGFGWADVENRSKAAPRTKFRIGSVSKPFTALLLVVLAEKKHIRLDAEIQEYVPAFPAKRWPITLRQLAAHLGGVRHYEGGEYMQNAFSTIQEGLAAFQDDPLVRQPGTEFYYSSYGYNLLGAAVENACGAGFGTCLAEHVIEPLGLQHSLPDDPRDVIPFRARPYAVAGDRVLRNAPFLDSRYKLPAGGLLSTPEDLVRRLSERGARHLYVDGGKTIQWFLDAGLLRQLIITTVPVLIGSGIPLFGPLRCDVLLRHIEARSFASGLVQSRYEVLAPGPDSDAP